MAFRSAGPSRPATPIVLPRWSRYVIPALAIVIALIVIVAVGAGVWTDWLWFRSIHYTSVFGTTYGVKWALFGIAAVFMMTVIGVPAQAATAAGHAATAGHGAACDRAGAADLAAAARPRCVAAGHRATPAARPGRDPRPDRAHFRPRRRGQLARLAAV